MKGMLWRGFGGREDELAGMFSSLLLNSFVKMTYSVCTLVSAKSCWFGKNLIAKITASDLLSNDTGKDRTWCSKVIFLTIMTTVSFF